MSADSRNAIQAPEPITNRDLRTVNTLLLKLGYGEGITLRETGPDLSHQEPRIVPRLKVEMAC